MRIVDELVRIPDHIVSGILTFFNMNTDQQERIIEIVAVAILFIIAIMWYMG